MKDLHFVPVAQNWSRHGGSMTTYGRETDMKIQEKFRFKAYNGKNMFCSYIARPRFSLGKRGTFFRIGIFRSFKFQPLAA